MELIPHYDDSKTIGTNQDHASIDYLITVYIRLDLIMLHFDQWHGDFLAKVYENIGFYNTAPGLAYLFEKFKKKKSWKSYKKILRGDNGNVIIKKIWHLKIYRLQ